MCSRSVAIPSEQSIIACTPAASPSQRPSRDPGPRPQVARDDLGQGAGRETVRAGLVRSHLEGVKAGRGPAERPGDRQRVAGQAYDRRRGAPG